MLVIRVELWSAITGDKTELARMYISNTGTGTTTRGNYVGEALRGRSTAQLDRRTVSKTAMIRDWPRQQRHVWRLVKAMLETMGY